MLLCFVLPIYSYENFLTYAYGQTGALLGSQFGLPGTNATYDYVVVGGGTGGLAIATRLAQNSSVSVAVVEAGGFYEIDNGNLSVVPGYANYYTGADPDNYQPLVDWGFSTVPQAVRSLSLFSLLEEALQTESLTPCYYREQAIAEYIMLEERRWVGLQQEITWYINGQLHKTRYLLGADIDH